MSPPPLSSSDKVETEETTQHSSISQIGQPFVSGSRPITIVDDSMETEAVESSKGTHV